MLGLIVRYRRLALLLAVAGLVGSFFALGLQHQLTLESVQAHRAALVQARERSPVLFAAGYLAAYILMAALAIPGALLMTVSGGAVFGLAEGVVLASFGSSIGATLALLASRFVFRDLVRRHFPARLDRINQGLEREGWVYLLSLRLVPAIPFFVVDVLFGLTSFPVAKFYAVSQVGMFPATVIYVNAGTQLEHLQSLSGIVSPGVLGSLVLLGCLPLGARLVVRWVGRPVGRQ